MKIERLVISNFRGIREVSLGPLGDMVIIAGQNGSGKSCIFDAIRLLKSVYGGYQANEWQQWMGEFQISLTNRTSDFVSMFNDLTKELRISCDFRFSDSERQYITAHADELLREKIWRTILPEAYAWGGHRMAMFAAQFRDREPEVIEKAKSEYSQLILELAAPTIRGEFFIPPGGNPHIQNSLALSIIFGTFRPENIGVIDYHGAQRHYGRESVQGINLNLETTEQQRSQAALYNYTTKYTNVKGEMAATYVKEILAEQAGVPRDLQPSLTNTLKELFSTFFPDKKFLGPQPTTNGALSFPVQTTSGSVHDLDELSSGEKEILYGYLRIRNSAPRHSIILLDEPELHLNPRLIRDLPQFYKKNLGEALGNQIWLVTHSDALLREVVGKDAYNVFHMLPFGNVGVGESQLKPLSATADLDLALVDLVGDLAAYRPGGKVVIFEGGGDSDFDQKVVSTLFPELQEKANLISGSNKVRVRALQETLEAASEKDQLPFKFYSITDKDADSEKIQSSSKNIFSWDVYHIENYFLEAKYIRKVIESLQLSTSMTEESIFDELRDCAKETLQQLVRHELADYANTKLVNAINTKTDPKAEDLSLVLLEAIDRSRNKINNLTNDDLSSESLRSREQELRSKYVESLADGSWTSKFRGRTVLKRFIGKHPSGVSYEVFRNLILAKMKDDNFRPEGMQNIVNKVLKE
ncbi:ATP-binding protein [Pseudomonas sp. 2FE]|uniref:AAA family ATPase n=1 Tax=Pseudomonas sp. 2FE TaxID=2502190 RepID=UPI0010F667EE|nr:ATP-binding protein [Pseudomonas sp. 2FE]